MVLGEVVDVILIDTTKKLYKIHQSKEYSSKSA